MKLFKNLIQYSIIIFTLMIIISIAVATSYIKSNGIQFNQLFDFSSTLSLEKMTFSLDSFELIGKLTKDYDTVELNRSFTFTNVDDLFISSDIETISFIEEDRQDILVTYHREKPDTKYYNVEFTANKDENVLEITAASSVTNIILSRVYSGEIVIHVPSNYHFKSISLNTNASNIYNNSIYTHTDELSIITDLSDININIDHPIKQIKASCDAGSIHIETRAAVETMILTADLGSISAVNYADLTNLSIDENMGDLNITNIGQIKELEISNDVGSVKVFSHTSIKSMDVESNLGSISIFLPKDNNKTISASTSIGSVTSDFEYSQAQSNADYILNSDLGSIAIEAIAPSR